METSFQAVETVLTPQGNLWLSLDPDNVWYEALDTVVRYLIIETVKIIVDARATLLPKGSSALVDKLLRPLMTRVLRRCLTFGLDNFPEKVRNQVVLAKLPLDTLFEFANEVPIIGAERGIPLEPEFPRKDIVAMHIHSKEQADKTYINSDLEVRNKEKDCIFGIKLRHAQKTVKLQEDYRVEYTKSQSLMTVLEPAFTPEHQDKIARLYREKGTLGHLIRFCLDLERETRRMLNLTASAHKLQEELRRELEQVEKTARHCQAAEESYKAQLEKCETLQTSINAKKASIVNPSLGRHPAPRQQEASATPSAEFAGPVTSSANKDQEMIEENKDKQLEEEALEIANYE